MPPSEKLTEAVVEALARMYQQAEPPLDFRDLRDNPDDYPDEWYLYHHLPHEEQMRIADSIVDEYNLSRRERHALKMNAITYYGPTANKERVEEHISTRNEEIETDESTVQAEDP